MNFAWSPVFFGAHDIRFAKYMIFIMTLLAAAAAGQFYRLRRPAGLLMLPYLAWLTFATALNGAIETLNPGASVWLFG
jgi:tryptophan-rich sensory protein